MVTPGDSESEKPYKFMENAPPKRSNHLHNFSMPGLKWSNPQFLRCMKVNSNGEIDSSTNFKHNVSKVESSEKRRSDVSKNSVIRRLTSQPAGENSKIQGGGVDGFEEIRSNPMFNLRTAADDEEEEEDSSRLIESVKPWNLRKRRAACNSPGENERGGGSRKEESKQVYLPSRTEKQPMKSLRFRGSVTDQEKERRKFSIPLSRKEIEEDFMAMLGSKPSRRPTKRPKIVQKQLDAIFPGLWLSEVTVDTYKVPDFVEPRKK